jgi:hypothetical protein
MDAHASPAGLPELKKFWEPSGSAFVGRRGPQPWSGI